MRAYALRRVLIALPTLLAITFVVYALVHTVPATPGGAETASRLSSTELAELRARYGLDEPLFRGYLRWLGRVLRLDLGRSFGPDRTPVLTLVGRRLPATLLLNLCALALAAAVALPLGIGSALRAGGALDRWAGVGTFLLYSVPAFWMALLLQALLATKLRLLPLHYMASSPPPTEWWAALADRAAHLVLPALCLALNDLAFLSRFARASVLEQLGRPFVRTARAKGLEPGRVLVRHVLRTGLAPLITLGGLLVPGMIGGSVIIERIFDWNGVGLLFFRAVAEHDVNVILGLTGLAALLTLAGTLAADLLYAWADPRVRYGRP